MTLDEAVKRNPYDPKRGNKSAYCRYLRYNVDGWYLLDSKEVRRRWQKGTKNDHIRKELDISSSADPGYTSMEMVEQ